MTDKLSTTEIVFKAVAHRATVEYLAAPPAFERPKRIHARRVLPGVRVGEPRAVRGMEAPVSAHAGAAASEGALAIHTHTPLSAAAAQNTASNVGEPSVATNGQIAIYTGNWYAAISSDGGRTFSFISPAAAFKAFDPPGCSFSCDQVVQYIPAIDTFVWLLQYGPDTGDNIQRLAFATSAEVAARHWRLFDLTAAMAGAKGAYLDFPDLAVGAGCLYLTTNVLPEAGAGSVVIRIPFREIAGEKIVARRFLSFDYNSFRVTQNCGQTACFASHHDSGTLAVFRWPEMDDAPTEHSIAVTPWRGGHGYTSEVPGGGKWLDRADPRITGAALAGREAWFAWTVDQGSGGRPHAFVQIARVDIRDMTLLENIHLSDPNSATAYAGLCSNARGDVAVAYMLGGGARFPAFMVGILTHPRRHMEVAAGARGPHDPGTGKGEWGDFLTVRPAHTGHLFAASGYTMDGPGNGTNRDATPHFAIFGRAADLSGH